MFKWKLTRLRPPFYAWAVNDSPAVNSPRQRATLVNTRSRETRLALTRAALQLWSEGDFDQAYAASTAADIARAAGVSKGTFYFHFANKEAVLLELAASTTQALIGMVERGIADEIPMLTLSGQMMAAMAQRVARTPKTLALQVGALGSSPHRWRTRAWPMLSND